MGNRHDQWWQNLQGRPYKQIIKCLNRTFKASYRVSCGYDNYELVDLYRNDKWKCDIVREYDVANSLLDKWIAQANNSSSFHEKDNRTSE